MPIQNILAIAVPIKLYLFPKLINSFSQLFFFFISIFKVLPCTKKSLDHVRSFNKVPTIVFFTEWFYFSCFAIPPVRPCAMKAIGCFKEMNNFFQPYPSFITTDKISVNASEDCHYTKSTAAAGYNHFIIFG